MQNESETTEMSPSKKIKIALLLSILLTFAVITAYCLSKKSDDGQEVSGIRESRFGNSGNGVIDPENADPIKNEPVFAPIKVIAISDEAEIIADEMIKKYKDLGDKIDSGDFLGARKFYETRQLMRSNRQNENWMKLDEEIGEAIYQRAFTNYFEMIKEKQLKVIDLFADEVIRRDEELKHLVASGKYLDIIPNFQKKCLKLGSIIKNDFPVNTEAVALELYKRADTNKPKSRDRIDLAIVDFTALVNEALTKDRVLDNIVKTAKISEVKHQFMTKTLKQYGVNDKMYENKVGVLNELIRRAENYLPSQTIRLSREIRGYVNRAIEMDSELTNLVESGQSQFVKDHFLNETMNLDGIDSNVTENSSEILRELIRRSDMNRIAKRQDYEKATGEVMSPTIYVEMNLKASKPKKRTGAGKSVNFAPEMNTVNTIQEYDHTD